MQQSEWKNENEMLLYRYVMRDVDARGGTTDSNFKSR